MKKLIYEGMTDHMKPIASIYFILCIILLSGCTAPFPSSKPTSEPTQALALTPSPTQASIPFLLSTPGSYFAGVQEYGFLVSHLKNRGFYSPLTKPYKAHNEAELKDHKVFLFPRVKEEP